MSEVAIELAVADEMTKTIRRVNPGGTLLFTNSWNQVLTIASAANPPPFIVPSNPNPVSNFPVNPHSSKPAQISPAYTAGTFFTYTAQIGNSTPEDPIVIIE